MKLVVIIGAGAVGKMTVGQELVKITDLRLFHSHMVVEPILEIFGEWNTAAVRGARNAILEAFAETDNYGLIINFAMDFCNLATWEYFRAMTKPFEDAGADVYYVELVADFETRLARNNTENRLAHKASKRDLEWSNAWEHQMNAELRLISHDGEMDSFKHYIKIDNTNLPPDVVAGMIKNKFAL